MLTNTTNGMNNNKFDARTKTIHLLAKIFHLDVPKVIAKKKVLLKKSSPKYAIEKMVGIKKLNIIE